MDLPIKKPRLQAQLCLYFPASLPSLPGPQFPLHTGRSLSTLVLKSLPVRAAKTLLLSFCPSPCSCSSPGWQRACVHMRTCACVCECAKVCVVGSGKGREACRRWSWQ